MFDTACVRLVRLKSNLRSPRREEGASFERSTSGGHLLTSVATKHRARLVLTLLGCLFSTSLRADDLPPLLGPAEEAAVVEALRCLKMTPADLSYKKDYAESPFRLGKVQRFLEQPLELPRYADRVIAELSRTSTLSSLAWFTPGALGQLLLGGQVPSTNVPEEVFSDMFKGIPPALLPAISNLATGVEVADWHLQKAFEGVPAMHMNRAVARYAVDDFHLEQNRYEVDLLGKLGIDLGMVRKMLERKELLDEEDDESARDVLSVFAEQSQGYLLSAEADLCVSIDLAVKWLANNPCPVTNTLSPAAHIRIETRLGPIIIGGAGPTHYTAEDDNALLIIDLGGDDTYDCHVGAANGLIGRPISICIDLGGNDTYRGGTLTQGAGVFGIGILVDCGGNDTYEGKHLCQGAGLYGVGILADYGGNDSYTGDINAQGAGMFGVGILWDKMGDDHYVARECSQGYGYTGGLGLLLDGSGDDTYFAGGKYSDHERQPEHYLSLSQGLGNE